jgi:hypothetical protein
MDASSISSARGGVVRTLVSIEPAVLEFLLLDAFNLKSARTVHTSFQSMNPRVSSIMAAKLLVSRCLPLVSGGNCAILTRKSSDFCIVGVRLLAHRLDCDISSVVDWLLTRRRRAASSLTVPWLQRVLLGDCRAGRCWARR